MKAIKEIITFFILNPKEESLFVSIHLFLVKIKLLKITLPKHSNFIILSFRLKRKHNLLRAIVRTNQHENQQ